MPLDDKTTSNGVDLNQIDVSKLALVEKDGLIKDITTKLKKGIEEAFEQGLDELEETLQHPEKAASDDPSTWTSNLSKPTPASKPARRSQSDPPTTGGLTNQDIKKQQDDFEKLRKLKDRVDRQMERVYSRQRKNDKIKREQEQRGKVFTSKGLSHAGTIDDIVDRVQKADFKELQKLRDQVDILRKNIELDTRGDEQSLLTKHAIQLQKALMEETQMRKTTFGKIQHAFTENAVNVTSIVAGLTAHSPLAGLATKYVLDKIKGQQEAKQEANNKNLRVSQTLQKNLPRKVEPEVEDKGLKLENQTLTQILQSTDDADQRFELLKNLRSQNQITSEQHEQLSGQFIPPHYVPLPQRIGKNVPAAQPQAQKPLYDGKLAPQPQAQQPLYDGKLAPQPAAASEAQPFATVNQPTKVDPEGVEGKDYVVYGGHKFKVDDSWQQRLKQPRKDRDEAEKMGWIRDMQRQQEQRTQEEYEKRKKNPLKPGAPGYDFFMDKDIFGDDPEANYYSRPKPHKMFGDSIVPEPSSKVVQMPQPHKAPVQPVAEAAMETSYKSLPPERIDAEEHQPQAHEPERLLAEVEKQSETTKQEDKDIRTLHTDVAKLEKLSEQQLEELRTINKHLQKQIEQAELDSEAARRETKRSTQEMGLGVPSDEGPSGGKSKKPGEGGSLLKTLFKDTFELGGAGLLGKFGKSILGKIPGLSKIPGIGKLLGKTGGEVAEAAGTAAEVAGKAGGVAEEGSMVGKLVSKIPGVGKILGGGAEAAGAAGKLGVTGIAKKVSGPLAIIMAAVDAIQGYNRATKTTGINEKELTTGDRLKSAAGSTLGGFLGLPGDLLTMMGINPKGAFHVDDSDTLKKELTKGIFHLAGNTKIEDSQKKQAEQTDTSAKLQTDRENRIAVDRGKAKGQIADVKPQTEPKRIPASVSEKPVAPPSTPTKSNQNQNIALITAELKKKGLNEKEIAAVLGNIKKESGFNPQEEKLDYSHTSNTRIRSIFGKERTNMSDEELDKLKKDPQKFAEAMYGSGSKVGRGMGNTGKGDGWNFRGRGFIQLTGRNNYAKASKEIFGDDRLVKDPNLANDPSVAAQIAAWYSERSGKMMAQKMGVDLKSGSQRDINAVYTSAVAGHEIKRGEGYLGNEVMNKVDQYTAANMSASVAPEKVQQKKPELTTVAMNTVPKLQPPSPTSGPHLAQQSTANSTMMKMAALEPPQTPGGNVFAPQNHVTNNSNTSVTELRAKNTESTYQRNMDAMYYTT